MSKPAIYSNTYDIEGIVQGVGFRPSVYRLAREKSLGGWIKNTSGSVTLCLIGEKSKIEDFVCQLPEGIPAQAEIVRLVKSEEKKLDKDLAPEFEIRESSTSDTKKIAIPADIAMCKDCEEEIMTRGNPRYGYAFTTCTNCGPRFTVVNDMPYDRERTTLSRFPLCEECFSEYISPDNRRFHAESTACPECGPSLFLTDHRGTKLEIENPLQGAKEFIRNGNIVAIRGIGGFLLTLDAFSGGAIERLRKRKTRPDKPFALMFRNWEVLSEHCQYDSRMEGILKSAEAPIFIAELKDSSSLPISLISPDTKTLGVMLPYSPLHKLLFESRGDDPLRFDVLLMTSGNRGGEPICISNGEAFERLEGIADFMLCHNREINLRVDDSIITGQLGSPQIWRRARGFAPNSLKVNISFNKNILSMGADLKNAIAIGYDQEIVLSPHIGDLENLESFKDLERISRSLPGFLGKEVNLIVKDLHPDFHSSCLADEISRSKDPPIPVVEIQHHHAHAASCMAENHLDNALALVFDGSGLGLDGSMWGAELFHIKAFKEDIRRLATFSATRLIGGDIASREPRRQVFARLLDADIDVSRIDLSKYKISDREAKIWTQQYRQGLNAPLSHSAGRLFDAFSALIGVAPETITYEGQAAIRLEAHARQEKSEGIEEIPFHFYEENDMLYIDWSPAFRKHYGGDDSSRLALAFHVAVARAVEKMIEFALQQGMGGNIVLSGGVFMNKVLNALVAERVKNLGLNLFIHRRVPPNDGGIALGQAVLANYRRIECV